jgi:segregation and condensation protein B
MEEKEEEDKKIDSNSNLEENNKKEVSPPSPTPQTNTTPSPKSTSQPNPNLDLREVLKDTSKENSKEDMSETIAKENPSILTGSTVDEIDDEFVNKEKNAENLVEASLFVAGKFMTMQDLIMLTDLNQIMIREILSVLKKKYSKSAITIVERNNAYKMDVVQRYHYLINKLATGTAEFTKAEQETLAVIAYKQPVKQSVIIKIRGNKSYDHIRKFRDLGLVVAKPVGHTLDLTLSEEFYEYFSIHQKDDNQD